MRNLRINLPLTAIMIVVLFLVKGTIWLRHSEDMRGLLAAIPQADFVWCRGSHGFTHIKVMVKGEKDAIYKFPSSYADPRILKALERSGMILWGAHDGGWGVWMKSDISNRYLRIFLAAPPVDAAGDANINQS